MKYTSTFAWMETSKKFKMPPGVGILFIFIVCYIFEIYETNSVWAITQNNLIELGANNGPLTLSGDWWRLVTTLFLHSSLIHLITNGITLTLAWSMGKKIFSTVTLYAIFITTGIVSGWYSAAQQLDVVTVGPAGAILGLLGATLGWSLMNTQISSDARRAVQRDPLLILTASLIMSVFLSGLDMYSTLGGTVSGVLLGLFVPSKIDTDTWPMNMLVWFSLLMAFTIISLFVLTPDTARIRMTYRDKRIVDTISYIQTQDERLEQQMLALWAVKESSYTEWQARWHNDIIDELQHNVVLANGLKIESGKPLAKRVKLIKQYTYAKYKEATLLEEHRLHLNTEALTNLRKNIMLLSENLRTLNETDLLPSPQ